MDTNLLSNVKNVLLTANSNTSSLNIEVIHVITWKDLKIDPTRSEVCNLVVIKIWISLN